MTGGVGTTDGVDTTDTLSPEGKLRAPFSLATWLLLFRLSNFYFFLTDFSDLSLGFSSFSLVLVFFDLLLSRRFTVGFCEFITSERMLILLLEGRSRQLLRLERRDNELSFFDLIGDDEDDLNDDLEDDFDKEDGCLDSADVCSVAVLEPDADDDDPSDLPDRLDLTDDLREVLDFSDLLVSSVTPDATKFATKLELFVSTEPGVLIRSVVSGLSAV